MCITLNKKDIVKIIFLTIENVWRLMHVPIFIGTRTGAARRQGPEACIPMLIDVRAGAARRQGPEACIPMLIDVRTGAARRQGANACTNHF